MPGDVLTGAALPPTATSRQMALCVDFPDAPARGPPLAVVPTGALDGVALEHPTATDVGDELCRKGVVVTTFDPTTARFDGLD